MVRAGKNDKGELEQVLPDGSTRKLVGRTDWARLAAMTEEEIEANAFPIPTSHRSPRRSCAGSARSPTQRRVAAACT